MTRVCLIRHGESEANAGAPTSDPAAIALTARGLEQASRIPAALPRAPSLVVTSPYLRTRQTAIPTRRAFPDARHEEWEVHEFTYLSPSTCVGTTALERRPAVEAYWTRCDPTYVHGAGAESFSALMARVHAMIDAVRAREVESELVAIFTHGQFMQAVMWTAIAGPAAPDAAFMRGYRQFCAAVPVANAAMLSLHVTESELLLGRLSSR